MNQPRLFTVASVSLLIVAAGLFCAAMIDSELGGFWAGLGAIAAVSAALAWFSPGRTATPAATSPFKSKPLDPRRARKTCMITFAVASTIAVAVIAGARWEPHADFDVTGILWLLQNGVPALVVAVALIAATWAAVRWISLRGRN
jgi:hypothetical protein